MQTIKKIIVIAIFKVLSTLNAFNINIVIVKPIIDIIICGILSNKYFINFIAVYTLVPF